MKTQTALSHNALAKIFLAFLALGLASCATKPSKPISRPKAETTTSAQCEGENAKPALECAKAPSATFDKDGRLWVVWEQAGKVYVNHSNDFGNTVSPPAAVNAVAESIETGGEARPKIVLTKAGAVYVAWTQSLGQANGGHIHFSRSLDGGKTFTTPLQVDGVETGHRLEALAVNDRDYIYLAWLDGRGKTASYSGTALRFSYSSDGGRSFHTDKTIADDACECCRLAVKIDSKKFPAILWRQVSGGHALTHFTAKDQPGPIQAVSEAQGKVDECPRQGPTLSISPQGEYYAAWSNRQGLAVSASLDHGKTFAPPVNFGQPERAAHPDLLADGQSVHLAWTETDGKKTVLLGQSSIDGGLSWSAPKPLAETESVADYPFLLAHQGRHYVAWQTEDKGFQLIAVGD